MEDHLKNKNRLEKEWEALCVYQAEPNSSLVAQREENVLKNRSPAVLTCMYPALALPGQGRERWGPGGAGGTFPFAPVFLLMAGKPSWPRNRVSVFLCGPGAQSWVEDIHTPTSTCFVCYYCAV